MQAAEYELRGVMLVIRLKADLDHHTAVSVRESADTLLTRSQAKHILFDFTIITQDELNHRLLDKYFPARDQLSLFNNQEKDNELLIKAYRNRNKEVGYYLK